MKLNIDTTMQYRFAIHTRRLTIIAIVSALVLVLAGSLVLLSTFPALSGAHDLLLLAAYLIGFLALSFLLPMLILLYSYSRSGVAIEPGRLHLQFRWEDRADMAWSIA